MRGRQESGSFLKKRTKKLLTVWAEPFRRGRSQNNQKFFAAFFQKRRHSLCFRFGVPGTQSVQKVVGAFFQESTAVPRWLVIAAALAPSAAAQAAGQALIIGNATFASFPPLPACAASVRLLSSRLQSAGYTVTAAPDLTNGAMDGAVADFVQQHVAPNPGSPVLIYVCSYGASLQERDFVLPVSARPTRPTDLMTEGILAKNFVPAATPGRTAPVLVALDLARDPSGNLAPATGSPTRQTLPPATGLAVVVETQPPSAPTEFAAALVQTLAAVPPPAGALTAATSHLAPGAVAGVQDAPEIAVKPPASAPAPPAPAPQAVAVRLPADADMSEADRRRVQVALAEIGYYDGKLDGVFGPDSRAAIRRWQHEHGAAMTGRLTAEEATRLAGSAH